MDRFSTEIELRKIVAQITVLIRRRTGIRIDRIRVFRLYVVGFFGSFVFGGGAGQQRQGGQKKCEQTGNCFLRSGGNRLHENFLRFMKFCPSRDGQRLRIGNL